MTDEELIRNFIEALQPVRVTAEGPYNHMDRYRDFATVFQSEAGRRVLAQIVDRADKPVREADLNNHALMSWRAGQRAIAQWITAVASVPPRQG